MLHINFEYQKKDGTIHSATNYFYDVEKAVRFAYVVSKSKDKHLIGWGADDSEEHELLDKKLSRIYR